MNHENEKTTLFNFENTTKYENNPKVKYSSGKTIQTTGGTPTPIEVLTLSAHKKITNDPLMGLDLFIENEFSKPNDKQKVISMDTALSVIANIKKTEKEFKSEYENIVDPMETILKNVKNHYRKLADVFTFKSDNLTQQINTINANNLRKQREEQMLRERIAREELAKRQETERLEKERLEAIKQNEFSSEEDIVVAKIETAVATENKQNAEALVQIVAKQETKVSQSDLGMSVKTQFAPSYELIDIDMLKKMLPEVFVLSEPLLNKKIKEIYLKDQSMFRNEQTYCGLKLREVIETKTRLK